MKIAKTILIVEDDQLFAEKLSYYLSSITDNITVVDSVARGVYLLSKTKIDFVFLDNKLPRINGIDVIHFFKEINPLAKIALMSGSFNNEEKKEARENGVDYVFDKYLLTRQEALRLFV
jgi:two-component system, NtrC family, nitrogen regulation response regulator NtrX